MDKNISNQSFINMVTIHSASFMMSVFPVTQNQWKNIMGYEDFYFTHTDLLPAESVTWYDSLVFCNKLSCANGFRPVYYTDKSFETVFDVKTPFEKEIDIYADWNAHGYRLPTEAEWEYACRAGSDTALYNNKDLILNEVGECKNLDGIAWYCRNSSYRTNPVGMKLPNAWGLYDMLGNVKEWCWDWYAEKYDQALCTDQKGLCIDSKGPSIGTEKVCRGGAWDSRAQECKCGSRDKTEPVKRYLVGFRVVRTVF